MIQNRKYNVCLSFNFIDCFLELVQSSDQIGILKRRFGLDQK